MDYVLCFLTLLLVVLGISTLIRYVVWKFVDFKQNRYHYLVFLHDDSAEIMLRGILERNNFDVSSGERKLYAVDMGLDEITASACEKLSYDYPNMIFIKPNQLVDAIKK
ncbi:MAG: hypothetical protein IKV36_02610 [Clostridia bacterium]|nr:hypothetical protein [Clostridia bacterium]